MLNLVIGNVNEKEVISKFVSGNKEDFLLIHEGYVDPSDIKSLEENFEVLISARELNFKVEENGHAPQMNYSEECAANDTIKSLNLHPGDVFRGTLFSGCLKASREDFLRVMIDNPLEEGEFNLEDMYTILEKDYKRIEISFQKAKDYRRETITCNIDMCDWGDDVASNRFLSFDLYGCEMLPYNHIICDDELFEVLQTISSITNWKYTFHSYGNPHITISKDEIKKWS